MTRKISAKYFEQNASVNIYVDLPNTCPHCGEIITPEVIAAFLLGDRYNKQNIGSVLVQCPSSLCKKFFALEYQIDSRDSSSKYLKYYYRPPIKVSLPQNIDKVSPSFVEIYSQATKAEVDGLDQIAGIGYRKALEFLIKDFCIARNPNEEEKIKKMFLGNVIKDYLSELPRIQKLAKASVWIGNDETHYVRVHEEKDIEDLKTFILAASQFIAAEYTADQASAFIDRPK